MTGKNPGKHGIFDFIHRKEGTYQLSPIHARLREGRPFWSWASDMRYGGGPDTNNAADVYVRDRRSGGKTYLASVSCRSGGTGDSGRRLSGEEWVGAHSIYPSVVVQGDYIYTVFSSDATDLETDLPYCTPDCAAQPPQGDCNEQMDVFLHIQPKTWGSG